MNFHGMHLYNNNTLYVLSHSYAQGGELIFVFNLIDNNGIIEAEFLNTIKLGNQYAIYNSILFMDDKHFYITQSMPFPDLEEGRDQSFLIDIYRTYLYGFTTTNELKFCTINNDIASCQTSAKGYMPNGLARNEQELFLADTVKKTVEIFEILPNFQIALRESVNVGHSVDNLHFHNGIIYVTGISKGIDYLMFTEAAKNNKTKPFVHGGVSIIYKEDRYWKTKEIIMQDMLSIPTSSAVIGNEIFISSFVDEALIFCPLDKNA